MTGPLVQSVSWALVNLLWQGVLVAGVLGLALRIVPERYAGVRYVLACGALLVMTVLPAVSAARHYAERETAVPEASLVASVPSPPSTALAAPPGASVVVPASAVEVPSLLVRVTELCERHAR